MRDLLCIKNNRKNVKLINDYIEERGERDFLLMYRACNQESILGLYECFQRFFSNSNFYFSSLVAKEIYDRGDRSGMTQMLTNFKTNNLKGEIQFEKVLLGVSAILTLALGVFALNEFVDAQGDNQQYSSQETRPGG